MRHSTNGRIRRCDPREARDAPEVAHPNRGPAMRMLRRSVILALKFLVFMGLVFTGLIFTGASSRLAAMTMDSPEWKKLVARAKAEGTLSVVGYVSGAYKPVYDHFSKKFGIKTVVSYASGRSHATRILAERRGAIYNVDVGHVGANTVNRRLIPAGAIAPIKPYLVLDEVTNTANWYGNRHWFTDPKQKYVFAHSADFRQTFVFFINTNLVKAPDLAALKSPYDLLRGKWKKRVVALSPMMGQSGNSYFRYSIASKPYGLRWMKKFIKSGSVEFVSSSRLIETGIARGKYAFAVFPHARPLDKMQKQGLPVKRVEHSFAGAPGIMTAGAPTQTVQVYDRAPHPNAAKLFVNWLLSKEGLTFVHDNVRDPPNPRNSLRKDVPKTNVDPGAMVKRGVKYFGADLVPKYQSQRFKIMKTLQGWYKETYAK